MQRKTFPISKVFVSIKTDFDENGSDSIRFDEKLNLKAFIKVQERTREICSNVNCSNEKQTRISSGSVNMTYIHFRIPPPMRSPVSNKGLPSIGEDQPPLLQRFLLFTGLGENPYKSHTSLE